MHKYCAIQYISLGAMKTARERERGSCVYRKRGDGERGGCVKCRGQGFRRTSDLLDVDVVPESPLQGRLLVFCKTALRASDVLCLAEELGLLLPPCDATVGVLCAGDSAAADV